MPIVWHPKKWWNFRMSEYKKKEIKTILTETFCHAKNLYSLKIIMNFHDFSFLIF